jgi:hypothetical protein
VGNQLPSAHQVAVCLLNPGIQQVRALSGRTLHDDAPVCPHRDIVIAVSSGIMVSPVELPRAQASATTGPLTTLTTITLSPHHDKCLALVWMASLGQDGGLESNPGSAQGFRCSIAGLDEMCRARHRQIRQMRA